MKLFGSAAWLSGYMLQSPRQDTSHAFNMEATRCLGRVGKFSRIPYRMEINWHLSMFFLAVTVHWACIDSYIGIASPEIR